MLLTIPINIKPDFFVSIFKSNTHKVLITKHDYICAESWLQKIFRCLRTILKYEIIIISVGI